MRDLVEVHFHGPLGDRFGHVHHLAVMTPREVIRAMDANHPGFVPAFVQHERYAIVADGDYREGEFAAEMPFSKEIHFVPIIDGQVNALVPLIASAFAIGTTAATIISGLLITGLMLGISFLFRPKMEKPESQARDESFIFTGPENVTGQGVAIPLIYGRVFAGSVVVSAGSDVEDLKLTTNTTGASKPPTTPVSPPPEDPRHPGEEAPPPTRHPGHDGFALMSLSAPAPADLPDGDSLPAYNMIWDGAGTEHLRDDPPPDGVWPDIIADPVYGWKPEGWILAKITWVLDEDDGSRKQVLVWQPDFVTADFVYNWDMVRGFYLSDVGITAENNEWIAGDQMENPVEDPAL